MERGSTSTMAYSKYDSYGGSSNDSQDENVEVIFTPEASIEAEVERAFGTESEYGQSLGVIWQDVEVTDGCLFFDAEKQKYKLFSWKKAAGMSPGDAIDRGDTLTVDDVSETITRTYVGNDKTYDLVAARVEEVTDEDGEVLIEADSKGRTVEDPDNLEFSDWEDYGGDPVPFETDMITWYDGSSEYGPSTSSKEVAAILTTYGEDAIEDEDDIFNWLTDTSGTDILRDDLRGKRMEYFLTTEQSEDGFNYHVPHFIDVEAGMEVVADNTDGGDSDTSSDSSGDTGNSDSGSALVESTAGNTMPEPVASFINSAESLELDPDRAENLLDDMISDAETALTDEMVDEAGGKGAVIQKVV